MNCVYCGDTKLAPNRGDDKVPCDVCGDEPTQAAALAAFLDSDRLRAEAQDRVARAKAAKDAAQVEYDAATLAAQPFEYTRLAEARLLYTIRRDAR